jgi:hypothetical protein
MSKYNPKCSHSGDKEMDSFVHVLHRSFFAILGVAMAAVVALLVSYKISTKVLSILFDCYQLGIDNLSDALTLMTETLTHLNTSSCNANHRPENSLLCV